MRAALLNELEDLALAACDDQHLEAASSREILSLWFEREVSYSELRVAFRRLYRLGLLRTYVYRGTRIVRSSTRSIPTHHLLVRGTERGREYLGLERKLLS